MVATPFHFLADMIQVEYNIKGGGVAVKRKYMVRQLDIQRESSKRPRLYYQ